MAHPRHLGMGGWGIVDVARSRSLLDPADPMHQIGCPRLDPAPRQPLVTGERHHLFALARCLVVKLHRKRRIARHVGHFPRFGGIGDIAVGQQHHWGHVAHCKPARLDRAVERVGGRPAGDHRKRSVAVAPIDRLIKVGLLGLGRKPGRRSAALRIDDHQRQLGHHRKPDRLGLERNSRPRRRGHPEAPGIACADCRADRRNLVLGLKGDDPIFLEPAEAMEQGRGRSDRIGSEKHRQARKLRADHQPEPERLGTRHGSVQSGLGRCRRDMARLDRRAQLDGLAISVSRVQRRDIGFDQQRRLGELGLEPVDDRRSVTIEHPQRKAERPHVLAAERLLVAKAERLHRVHRQLRDIELDQLPPPEAVVLERVGEITRLGQVAGVEFALVDDDQAAVAKLIDVHLERRRVHRDQHIGLVACGFDRGRAEIDLEGRNSERRTLRGADFGRKVGEGRKIVSRERGRKRELTAGQLHPVAAVAGKPNDHGLGVNICVGFLRSKEVGGRGHSSVLCVGLFPV